MSVINRALRDIDARREGDAETSRDDALMRAYAAARLPCDGAGRAAGANRSRRWPVLAAVAALAGTAGAAIAFGVSDGGAWSTASGRDPSAGAQVRAEGGPVRADGAGSEPAESTPAAAVRIAGVADASIAGGRVAGATTASDRCASAPVADASVAAASDANVAGTVAASHAPPSPATSSAVALPPSSVPQAAIRGAIAPAPAAPAAAPAPRERDASASIPAAPPVASIDVRPRPAGAEELQAAAAAALSAGDPEEAQRLLRAALALDPSLHTARQALLALLGRGERGAAWHAALEDAAAASPERFGLLAARGLADGGRIDAALVALARVPVPMRGVEYLTTAGLVAQRGERHALAVENLAEALSRTPAEAPTAPALRVALAESLAAGGDAATARSHLAAVAEQPAARAELRALARRRLESLPR